MSALPMYKAHYAPLPSVSLRGVPLSAITERECIDHVMRELDARRGGWLVTVNLDVYRRYVKDETFRDLIRDSTFLVADGMPLIWASRLAGSPLPERIAGSTLMLTMNEAAAARGRAVFLLGGNEGAAEGAAKALRARFPGVNIVGAYCPPFGFEKDAREMLAIQDMVVRAGPDIIYVALGCPKQERLIVALRPVLPKAWFTGVGISFSFLSGEVRRAPLWMQRVGLEWFHRMLQEPGRLVRRYLVENAPFALRLFTGAFLDRFRRPRADSLGAHA